MKEKGYFLLFITFYILFIVIIFVQIGLSDELASKDIEKYIEKESGNSVTVYVSPNSKTKKGDLYIKVIKTKSPSKDKVLLSIVYSVGKLTEESIAYKIYLDTILIEIKNRLYAINSESCRAVFDAKTDSERSKIIQYNLKTLK